MKTDLDMEPMRNIADLYYNSNLTQSEIVHRYNISRSKVSRLLTDAWENGIVKTFIDDRNEISRPQEEQLLKHFPLKVVKAISVPHDDDQLALQTTAQETVRSSSGFSRPHNRIEIP